MRDHSVISELYYGSIHLNDRSIEDPLGAAALNAFSEHEEWLDRYLSGAARQRFLELVNCHSTITGTLSYENFRVGFQLGVAFMMEALQLSDDIFYEL